MKYRHFDRKCACIFIIVARSGRFVNTKLSHPTGQMLLLRRQNAAEALNGMIRAGGGPHGSGL
jgi:hypothetical protein